MERSEEDRFPVRLIVYAVVALLLLLLGYLAITGFSAYRSLSAARSDLVTAQESLTTSPAAAQEALQSAQGAAASASDTLNGPVWSVVSAVPYFGATPDAAGVAAESLNQALTALQPAFSQLSVLNPSTLAQSGTIDISAVEKAVPAAESALPGIEKARQTLSEAPTSGLLLGQVRDATQQLDEQLTSLDSTLANAVKFGKVVGPLLGQDGEKRYFLGLLNPNETRGTGGFLGTYGILTANNGSLTVDEIGSNTDLPDLDALPPDLGQGFEERYADDPTLVGNMNISPHFPSSAKIWLAAWKQKTGEQLDGAIALDIVSLGDIVNASGQPVTLPDGTQMSGEQLTTFALRDIYTKFPDSATRKEYQEAVAESALKTVTALPKPIPMGQALGKSIEENRVVIWSTDPAVEEDLIQAGLGGSLVVADGHNVQAVVINASASKLDAWMTKAVTYNVGRCAVNGRVKSSLAVDIRSDVPLGNRPPPYMMGAARMTPTGPVNFVMVQAHLPNGARLTNVKINGKSEAAFEFTEQDRPAAMVYLELPPRLTQRIEFIFNEPASTTPGTIVDQPLGENTPSVVNDTCINPDAAPQG